MTRRQIITTVVVLLIGVLFAAHMECKDDRIQAWAEKACAEVNDQNWRQFYWDDSSQDFCLTQAGFVGWPCLVDGTPAMCFHDGDDIVADSMVYRYHTRASMRKKIDPELEVVFIGDPPEEFDR